VRCEVWGVRCEVWGVKRDAKRECLHPRHLLRLLGHELGQQVVGGPPRQVLQQVPRNLRRVRGDVRFRVGGGRCGV
jgi:hypothetical protein